jgi:type II secretory pathway component PulJ
MECKSTFTKSQSELSSRRRQASAFTLIEVMVAFALSLIVATVVAALIFYSARSYVTMGNYTEMGQKSQMALDKMSKEIRQAKLVTGCTTNSITLKNPDGTSFSFSYDADARKMQRTSGTKKSTYLMDCDSLTFWVFQHTMKSNTFDCYDPAYLTNARVVQVTWRCSRQILGKKATTESVQSSKIVLRNH